MITSEFRKFYWTLIGGLICMIVAGIVQMRITQEAVRGDLRVLTTEIRYLTATDKQLRATDTRLAREIQELRRQLSVRGVQ